MSPTVTRAVRFLSTMHNTTAAVRAGEKSMDEIVKATIFSPQHFPKFLALSCSISGLAGFHYMNVVRDSVHKFQGVSYIRC